WKKVKPLIRRVLAFPLLIAVFAVFALALLDYELLYQDSARLFYQTFGYALTGSINLVTAIYLDFRLLDTLFEAGILLVAVTGVSYIAQHEHVEHNPLFMLDRFKIPELFVSLARIIYPIVLLFGIYVIFNGHLAPGGGFQGGSILATALLILYYIDLKKKTNLQRIFTIEKWLYLFLLGMSMVSIFTRGVWFTNFVLVESDALVKSIFLIALNLIIGAKVALGLTAIFIAFLKEGR
ncbi:MAG: MnhB domain-containing protein, partial [Bacilli bacterium]